MLLNELTGEQRRQLIDTQQVYQAWREADADKRRRFAGSMRWAPRNRAEYLLRKQGRIEQSLGLRNPETEAIYAAFIDGRAANKEKLSGLSVRLDDMAPVNRAMGLGRLHKIAARILRRCDEKELLGRQIFIVGTNALFAYEALAGVHVQSGLIATGDVDLLYDARRQLNLALDSGLRDRGFIGLLQKIDKSFGSTGPRSYRASNKDGYLVDLIRPQARNVFSDQLPAGLTELAGDLEGVAIIGLNWLLNAPKLEAVAIDERGYPARLVVIDPRAFALHKAWLAARPNREPLKAQRDVVQARAAALIASRYLGLSFEAADLDALPAALRDAGPPLLEEALAESPAKREAPDW